MGQSRNIRTGDKCQSAAQCALSSLTTITTGLFKIALLSVLNFPQTMPTAALIITGTMSLVTMALTTVSTLFVKDGPLAEDLSYSLKTCILVNMSQKNSDIFLTQVCNAFKLVALAIACTASGSLCSRRKYERRPLSSSWCARGSYRSVWEISNTVMVFAQMRTLSIGAACEFTRGSEHFAGDPA